MYAVHWYAIIKDHFRHVKPSVQTILLVCMPANRNVCRLLFKFLCNVFPLVDQLIIIVAKYYFRNQLL